ncbi:MAG: DUF4395 family protein, partial [Planctomycetota bacterium]
PLLKTSSAEKLNCSCDTGANRFACMIGFVLLTIGIFLHYLGKTDITWVLVLLVGTLSVLAGTTGFCLGTAIYGILFRKKEKDVAEK